MRFFSLCCLLFAGSLYAQQPIALSTSDPKFAPRWETIPGPSLALGNAGRRVGYNDGVRPPGSYEIAYRLVDEQFKVSPVSPAVTINPTCHDWDCVGTTPNVPLWTRATGIYWVWRTVGQTEWKPFATDINRQHQWLAVNPFKPICGWQHAVGGHWLYQAGNFSTWAAPQASAALTVAPPVPVIRLLECPNKSYIVRFSWACNQNETPLSPPVTIPAVPGNPDNKHTPFSVVRNLPAGAQQPPQGALGMFVYLEVDGVKHRQPCPDGHTGYLWSLDTVTLPINQFVATGISPGSTNGRSYLSSLHLALRDWGRDIIVDVDQTICCPLVSEFSGATWSYQPRNTWIASYWISNGVGTWTLTIDGVTTPPMPRTNNFGGGWAQWQPVLDATFGAGNVTVSSYWPWFAPKLELTGKWATQDLLSKVAIICKESDGTPIDPNIPATQTGQGWVMSHTDTKFVRTISTSNSGGFVVQDTATTPDAEAVTGYLTGWPLWLECSQRTTLVGCRMILMRSNCGFATCDNSGGGCFHFRPTNCSVGVHFTNTLPVTFGFRCLGSSSYYDGNHLCSETIMEGCFFQAKFPIVMEGNQAVNWQIRDTNFYSDGTFDSAAITAANAGTLTMRGRVTADNVRCLVAAVWVKGVYMEALFVDKGLPCLVCANANSWPTLTLYGGKINQTHNFPEYVEPALVMAGYQQDQLDTLDWTSLSALAKAELNYLHCFEAVAGPAENYKMRLITDQLESQENGVIAAGFITPKTNCLYKPRAIDEVPSLLQTLLP